MIDGLFIQSFSQAGPADDVVDRIGLIPLSRDFNEQLATFIFAVLQPSTGSKIDSVSGFIYASEGQPPMSPTKGQRGGGLGQCFTFLLFREGQW